MRKNDTQDLVPNFSRTDGFKYSFFNRIVNEWNGLPNHIRESNSIATLKKNVLSFIKDCWFSHDVTKIQTKKLSILPRVFFHDALEQLKTNFHTNFRFKRVLGFAIEYD